VRPRKAGQSLSKSPQSMLAELRGFGPCAENLFDASC
jgi:hypothetical protein